MLSVSYSLNSALPAQHPLLSTTQTAEMSNQPPVKPTGFFSLPAELRNEIYDLILQQPNNAMIQIKSTGFTAPGLTLLRTCKQIYHEATPIFYTTNRFRVQISKYNSDTALKFTKLTHHIFPENIKARNAVQLYARTHFLTEPSWKNLMVWLKRYHAREVHCSSPHLEVLRAKGLQELVPHVVGGMFEAVKKCRTWKWEQVEVMLVVWRESLGTVDPRWMVD